MCAYANAYKAISIAANATCELFETALTSIWLAVFKVYHHWHGPVVY